MKTNEEIVKELTLKLLYLTSREEKPTKHSPGTVRRSWKSYDWAAIDALVAGELIDGTHKAKSVWISDEGCNKARELLQDYNIG
jgi:hypothetical protein